MTLVKRIGTIAAGCFTLLMLAGSSDCDLFSDKTDSSYLKQGHRLQVVGGQLFEVQWIKGPGYAYMDIFRMNPDGSATFIKEEQLPPIFQIQGGMITPTSSYPQGSVTALFESLMRRANLMPKALSPLANVYLLGVTALFQMDPSTGLPLKTLDLTAAPLTGSPSRFAVTSDGQSAVISNENGRNQPYVLFVDVNTFTISATLSIPENANAYGVAITPDNKFAYVVTQSLSTATNSVYVIDLTTRQIATTIPLPKYSNLSNIVITPDGTEAYLASCCGGNFQIPLIDILTNTVATDVSTVYYSAAAGTVPLLSPVYIAMHPDGSRVYLAPIDGGQIRVLDTATNLITKLISVPQGAAPAAATDPVFSPDGRFLYVSDGPAAVSIIDTFRDTQVGTIPLNSQFAATAPGARKLGLYFVPGP